MLKMYHYSKHGNTVLKDGLFGIRKSGRSLALYAHRAQTEEPEKIYEWLDSTFPGRSQSVSCLTEKIVWQGNDKALKSIVDGCDLFSFELEQLVQDGIVTAIWCKNGSDAGGYNEKFKKIGLGGIDYSPLTWEKSDSSKDLLFAVVRHYMLVLKDGVIPPRYLQKEN
ncbi:MAG TPA: hypothetical protein IAD20_00645 [Candidatus Scatocola faecipullorum]|uniref:Uncharacterized protein n=1 Tax=Candidatus Scatocola faecipullorum TaxID=2840917 RepID=A0A9D1M2D5_9PROT|nr:hypothetical protein [Candidatus Scatocola faecipullorum]